jgi:dTDP-glucose pyrophosphorylase
MEEYKKQLIKEKTTMKDAMRHMDSHRFSTLFVVDENYILKGALTDGDIRRAILKGLPLTEKIENLMNKSPMKIFKENLINKKEIKEKMKMAVINHVPLVDNFGKVKASYSLAYFSETKTPHFEPKNTPVVIMAGGEGTRLRPLTGILPKPLAPLGNKPIIQKIVENFKSYGFQNFKVSVNYMANMIKTYFDYIKSDYNISFINEEKTTGKKLGTAGSLKLMKDDLVEPFFVSNCDILIDANYNEILNFHRKKGNLLTIVGALRNTKIPYGVLNIGKDGVLRSIEEKPEYDHLINTGMYVLSPETIHFIPRGEKFNMTDLMEILTKKNLKVGIFPVRSNQWFDIGQWKEYETVLQNIENKDFKFKQG